MKKSITVAFVIGLVSIVLVSCHNTKQESDPESTILYEIDYSHDNQSCLIPSIVKAVDFIPLHGSIENPISHIDELQVTNNGIHILDKRRNKLHVYDKDGNRLFSLQSMGHAKQEYLEIACFAVTDSSIFVVDNFGKKINEYGSTNGIFKNSYPTPIVIGSIRPLKNGDFILGELPMDGVNELDGSDGNRLYIADSSFRIKSSSYPYVLRDKIGMRRFFSDNDSIIIYASTGYNGFTKISAEDGSILGKVALNTSNPFNAEEISQMELYDAMNHIDKNRWQFLTTAPMTVGKYTYLSVRDNESSAPCIYDANLNKLFFNDKESMHDNLIAPDDAYGDSYYTVYNHGGEFLDNQLKMGFNQPPFVADSIIRNNGAVLLRYRMKID